MYFFRGLNHCEDDALCPLLWLDSLPVMCVLSVSCLHATRYMSAVLGVGFAAMMATWRISEPEKKSVKATGWEMETKQDLISASGKEKCTRFREISDTVCGI